MIQMEKLRKILIQELWNLKIEGMTDCGVCAMDSSPAYYCIKKGDKETYVAKSTDVSCWRHVDGKENPADLLTRGVLPKDLVDSKLWLHGLSWITME